MKRNKKYTRQFNRKLKELNSYKTKLTEVVKMIGLPQQAIDYADAGLDVNIKCEISTKKLLEILRG